MKKLLYKMGEIASHHAAPYWVLILCFVAVIGSVVIAPTGYLVGSDPVEHSVTEMVVDKYHVLYDGADCYSYGTIDGKWISNQCFETIAESEDWIIRMEAYEERDRKIKAKAWIVVK